jgi:hypothetical protein
MEQNPVPRAVRSKTWVCGRSPAETVGSNPTRGIDISSTVSVVCCQVELITHPEKCGASLCVI